MTALPSRTSFTLKALSRVAALLTVFAMGCETPPEPAVGPAVAGVDGGVVEVTGEPADDQPVTDDPTTEPLPDGIHGGVHGGVDAGSGGEIDATNAADVSSLPEPVAATDRVVPGTPVELEILPRALWGAQPIDADNAGRMGVVRRVTVHHTGEAAGGAPIEFGHAAERMRSYQATHQQGRGWADIGYHYVIDGAGRLWEGRSVAFRGAHAGNADANEGNLGIAVMGNFDRDEPAPEQLATLARLLASLRTDHGLAPDDVHTHDDIRQAHGLGGTACPGRHLAAWLAEHGGAATDASPR